MTQPLRQLIARCRDHDEAAIAEIVQRFQAWALDLAMVLLGDHGLAQDAVQEAFVTAMARLDDLRTPEAFPGWFRQIVRTQCNRILRRPREQLVGEGRRLEAQGGAVEPDMAQKELRRQVRQAVSQLSPTLYDATRLFYLEEHSCSEIAEQLGIPRGTVKRRLHDARDRLRDLLLGIGDKP